MNSPNHKTYILTYFAGGLQKYDHTVFQLENFLRHNEAILGFWNYIPLVYCLKSRLHSSQLTQLLAPILNTQFIICEIKPDNIDGQLPQVAWDWFYAAPEPKVSDRSIISSIMGSGPPALSNLGQILPPKK